MRATGGQARERSPKNKEGYIFIIKEKVGREEDHFLPHSCVDVKAYIISSSFDHICSNWDCHGSILIIYILAEGW